MFSPLLLFLFNFPLMTTHEDKASSGKVYRKSRFKLMCCHFLSVTTFRTRNYLDFHFYMKWKIIVTSKILQTIQWRHKNKPRTGTLTGLKSLWLLCNTNSDYFHNQKDNVILETTIGQRLQVFCLPGSLLDSQLWTMERK